jgi:NAD(P)H dehydrogenase (quinone)
MPKIVIIYDSATGNTEKMAHAVAEGAKSVKGTDVIVKKVDEAEMDDLLKADGIIIGSPTYFGQMSAKLKAFVDESEKYLYGKLDGRVGAAFTSSGGEASGAETTLFSIIQAMLIHGMVVLGRSKDRKHYGAASVGSPDKDDVEDCMDLGQKVAELAKKLSK